MTANLSYPESWNLDHLLRLANGVAGIPRLISTIVKRKLVLSALLVAILGGQFALAQSAASIGLPVIFVHGICDTPDSFIPLESAVKTLLQNHYPAQYPPAPSPYPDEYVAFFNGTQVWFQVPTADIHDPLSGNPVSTVPSSTRFFLVALDDPNQSVYQNFDAASVMGIPIYAKGNELAQVIWKVKAITGAPRVIVVGHSMGGLDARAYIEGLASTNGTTDAPILYQNDIAELVTLDTPHGGSDLARYSDTGLAGWFGACAVDPSVDKAELAPTGSASVIPQLDYIPTTNTYPYSAQLLPPDLTITSISSYWYNPGFVQRYDEGTDDVLTSLTQDLQSNIFDTPYNSNSTLASAQNTFTVDFPEYGNPTNSCGTPATPLHSLACTGSAAQTMGAIDDAVYPFTIMTTGQMQITPSTTTLAPYQIANFSASTGPSTIWNILEGPVGGSIQTLIAPDGKYFGVYDSPPNQTSTTQTFHIVAINSQNPNQYAIVPVQVTSSVVKTATTTVLATSASQIPVGASISVSANVQAISGTPTGVVTFYDSGNVLGREVVNNAGYATYTTSSFALGFHSITANYSGDSNFTASTSAIAKIAVVAIDPELMVSPSSGTLGVTSFVKTDTGFTPYGLITHTATLPDGSLSVLQTYAGGDGTYSYDRTYSAAGAYSQIDTDVTSGQTTTLISWTVSTAVANDFSLEVSPSSQSVSRGSSATYNAITTITSGSTQSVVLSTTNGPSGLTASFSPTTVVSGSQSTLTVAASSSVPTGTYTLTVTGTGTSATHTYQISATVTQAATGPAVTLNPSIVRFNDQPVGSVSSPEAVLLLNSGSGQLQISSIALQAGSDYVLTLPSPAPPSILNPLVPYDIQVSFAPTTTGTRSGEILVYDNAPDSPQIVKLSGNGIAAQPSTGTINVNATLNGIAVPSGYQFGYTLTGPASYTGGDSYSFAATPGQYTIAFNGYPGYLTLSSVTQGAMQTVSAGGSITFTLNFTAPSDFYAPYFTYPAGGSGVTPQIVVAGSSAPYTFGLGNPPPGNASVPVTLSVTGPPPGTTSVFNPQPVYTGYAGALTIGTSTSTPPGVYTLTLAGTNANGLTHTGGTSTLVVTTPPSSPVQLVSESSNSIEGNAASTLSPGSISADGRYVVFTSSSTNLIPTSAGSVPGIFLRDLTAGTITLVSASSSGTPADGTSIGAKISADGRYIVFASQADNLIPGVGGGGNNAIFLRDLQLGTVERVDLANDGSSANANSFGAVISADGRFVAFLSSATNLVSGSSGLQVYMRDRKTGTTTLITIGTDGSPSNSAVDGIAMSADGRFVTFVSAASNLVSQNISGLRQAFIRDLASGTTSLVSSAADGSAANASILDAVSSGYGPLAMSADGRFVVFNSAATNLVSTPLDGVVQHLFLRDTQASQTNLVDVDSVGTPLGGWSGFGYPSISADGRFISLWGFLQVLIRDTVQDQTAVVSLASNGSAGNEVSGQSDSALSPNGAKIAFDSSSSNLVANDSNGVSDAFVAQNPFIGSSSVQSLTLATPSTSGGTAVSGTITLSSPAPAGGATVAVWSNNTAAQPPPIISIPAGATSAPFSITTSLVSTETVMTILASYNGGVGLAVLTLEPSAELTVSPSAWDFGYQPVGSTSAAEDFALTNSGTATLALNSVQLSNGQVFSIGTNTCGASVAPGGSCSVSLTFTPNASGSTSDALQISYGSPASIQSLALIGNGATPIAAVSPSTLSLSSPGGVPATAMLTNSGNASLSNISATFTGANTADFQILSDGCSGFILPANSSCLITLSFAPTATGTRLATLSVSDNATGSPQTIGLTGTFVQATPALLWNPSSTSLLSGSSLGSGILDAVASVNGNNIAGVIAYTATLSGGMPQAVTVATVLPVGRYALTATFTPTDSVDYTTATATQTLIVTTQNVWIVNSVGSLSELSANGTALTSVPISGGGQGIAIDGAGSVWSIAVGGGSVTRFSNTGASATNFNSGISSATALAIDGAGQLWIANGNGSISILSSAGLFVSSAADPSISRSTGVAIDMSGNVWISNSITSTVDEIVGGATPVVPLATGVQSNTLGAKP